MRSRMRCTELKGRHDTLPSQYISSSIKQGLRLRAQKVSQNQQLDPSYQI